MMAIVERWINSHKASRSNTARRTANSFFCSAPTSVYARSRTSTVYVRCFEKAIRACAVVRGAVSHVAAKSIAQRGFRGRTRRLIAAFFVASLRDVRSHV
jgi:hypothetical protein